MLNPATTSATRGCEADQLIICPPHSDKPRPAGYLSLIAGHNKQSDPPESGVNRGAG